VQKFREGAAAYDDEPVPETVAFADRFDNSEIQNGVARQAMRDDWYEETTDPLYADTYGLYKVEQWDVGDKIGEVHMLFASSNLQRVHKFLDRQVSRRPAGCYTIRQGTRVVRRWAGRRSWK
jgi:hypothetical protein